MTDNTPGAKLLVSKNSSPYLPSNSENIKTVEVGSLPFSVKPSTFVPAGDNGQYDYLVIGTRFVANIELF